MSHLPSVLNTQLQSTSSPVAWPDNCQLAVASLFPHTSAESQASSVQACVWFKCTELFSEIFACLNHLSSQMNYCRQMDFSTLAPTLLLTSCIPSSAQQGGGSSVCVSVQWKGIACIEPSREHDLCLTDTNRSEHGLCLLLLVFLHSLAVKSQWPYPLQTYRFCSYFPPSPVLGSGSSLLRDDGIWDGAVSEVLSGLKVVGVQKGTRKRAQSLGVQRAGRLHVWKWEQEFGGSATTLNFVYNDLLPNLVSKSCRVKS